MSETVYIPPESVRARSLVAGAWYPGDWIPAGDYQIVRNPAGVFRCLIPAGQESAIHIGTYYYPLEPHKWK